MSKLEIRPAGDRRWEVAYEGDPTPLSTHDTLAAAETEARSHAREFGAPIITVRELDGDVRTMIVDPEHDGPAKVRDVKGPSLS